MSYSTLMVNLALGQPNTALLAATNALAQTFGSTVIGIASRQQIQIIYTDGCYVSPEIIQDDRDEIDRELRAAEAEFRGSVDLPGLQWRSAVSIEPPSDYVVREARGADLLLTGMPSRNRSDTTRVGAGELVMQTGRPVVVVPPSVPHVSMERVILAWKDTRETRRAAWDAVPLLKRAAAVTVVEIVLEDDLPDARARVADVARWLRGHGVTAETEVHVSTDNDADQLRALSHSLGADCIVAGAYGHSRVREWALGGVTRDLLMRSDRCAFLSH